MLTIIFMIIHICISVITFDFVSSKALFNKQRQYKD